MAQSRAFISGTSKITCHGDIHAQTMGESQGRINVGGNTGSCVGGCLEKSNVKCTFGTKTAGMGNGQRMNGSGVKRDNGGRQGASNLKMAREREDGAVNYCEVCGLCIHG